MTDLLNEQYIKEQLKTYGVIRPCTLHLFDSIDSTNQYLKDLAPSSSIDICCAEEQTLGRGRFGRHWHSPLGENIYCSIRWTYQGNLAQLSGLSLVVSMAVRAMIKEINPTLEIKIKWPNDLLWNEKKLCGSLIEMTIEPNCPTQIIIGVGLNVHSDTKNHPLPDKPWCSLYEMTQIHYNRNQLIAHLISTLERYIDRFIHYQLTVIMDEWKQGDYLINKSITVQQSSGLIYGVAKGVDSSGHLILEDEHGVLHYLASGDTSLNCNKLV